MDGGRRDRTRRWLDGAMTVLFSSTGAVAILFIFLIFLFTFKEALPVFTDAEVRKEATSPFSS